MTDNEVVERFIDGTRADLGAFVRESGLVLYSSPKTLRPGDIYLLGVNPGADRTGIDGIDIESHLNTLASKNTNNYIDGEWLPGRCGEHPFQRRVVWLLRSLGFEPRDVCASNLIFIRSDGEDDCGYPAAADRCWPVHQRILGLVQPRLIICIGNLPFEYILGLSHREGLVERISSGHGSWQCQAARVRIDGRLVDVVSVPHLSRYKIIDKLNVVDWMRGKLAGPQQPVPITTPTVERIAQAGTIPTKVAPLVPRPVVPTLKAEQGYQIPWDGISGYIVLTGEPFDARGARGRAWDTLRTRNWIPVRDWIPIAKKAGNANCGRGDLEILCMERRATVIVDSTGKQLYPPTDGARYWKRT